MSIGGTACLRVNAATSSIFFGGEQGGEFAFVAFGMAERLGIIEPQLCKLLLTTVAISMAATPALSNFSAWVADQV